jgi:hypothetical protein
VITDPNKIERLITGVAETSDVRQAASQLAEPGRFDEVVDELAAGEIEAVADALWGSIKDDPSFRQAVQALLDAQEDSVSVSDVEPEKREQQAYALLERRSRSMPLYTFQESPWWRALPSTKSPP